MNEISEENNITQYKFKGNGLSVPERNLAKKRFDNYRERYHIDNLSDLQLLEELVFAESLQERTKLKIGKLGKNKETNEPEVTPVNLQKLLSDNLEIILILKEKLGLFEIKKDDDAYKKFKILDKKFKKWLKENQGSRTFPCPHCSKIIMLKIKTDSWDTLKHPFFKDKILTNEHLWDMYKEGKITKLDLAKSLLGKQVESTDYIDWLEEHIYRSNPTDKSSPDTSVQSS